MKGEQLQGTDSIQEMARFWDTHELTDFEEELEEVTEPVFADRTVLSSTWEPAQAEAVQKFAESKGIVDVEPIRDWVREKLAAS